MRVGPFPEVLAAAQTGAEWAFAVLYREANPRLLRYFGSRARSEAQDLAAETWMAVARQIGSFEGNEDDFRRWLFTIAHHQLVGHYRSAGRRRDEPVPDSDLDGIAAPADPADDVVGALSAQQAVERMTAALSPEQAEIVLLRVLGGLTVEQVAEIVGKRPGAVRVAQHRALKKLADANFVLEVTP